MASDLDELISALNLNFAFTTQDKRLLCKPVLAAYNNHY